MGRQWLPCQSSYLPQQAFDLVQKDASVKEMPLR